SRTTHRLSQCRRSQKRRHQHHILNPASRQRVTQFSGFLLTTPRHTGRQQLITSLVGALPSTQNRRNHLIRRTERCRILAIGDSEVILIDGHPVGISPLNQPHAHRRGCHRHTKYGLHPSSKSFAKLLRPAPASLPPKPRTTSSIDTKTNNVTPRKLAEL